MADISPPDATELLALSELQYVRPERAPLYAEVCARISKGETLTAICEELHMPSRVSIHNWMDNDLRFAREYAKARADGYDRLADECLQIADDATNDFMDTEHGPQLNKEHVQRSKLRIETRLKLLAKWDPKRYGEKTTMDLNAVVEQKLPLPQLQAEINRMLSKGVIDVTATELIANDTQPPKAGG